MKVIMEEQSVLDSWIYLPEVVEEGGEQVVISAYPPLPVFLPSSTFILKDFRVYDGDRMIGYVSQTHSMILECASSLAKRGICKFTLLDVIVELESLFPESNFMETTISARLRELCQWKLLLRESDGKKRNGIYIYIRGLQ